MLAALIVAAVVILTLGSSVRRMFDLQEFPLLFWPVGIACVAVPAFVAWTVLQPGEPIGTAQVTGLDQTVSLEVPAGYSLLVTAELAEDEEAQDSGKTVYNFSLTGEGWAQTAAGTIKRKTASSGPDIDLIDGKGISESGTRRSGRWGEDLQDRIDLDGSGTVTLEVSNWQGSAVKALVIDVVKGPPPGWILWCIVVIGSLCAIIIEVRNGADRLASDVAFLLLYGLFLRDGVTPLDDFQGVAWAAAPAALLGWLVVGGLAYLAVKYAGGNDTSEPPVEAKSAAPPPDDASDGTTRRRRRRR